MSQGDSHSQRVYWYKEREWWQDIQANTKHADPGQGLDKIIPPNILSNAKGVAVLTILKAESSQEEGGELQGCRTHSECVCRASCSLVERAPVWWLLGM